MIPKKTIKKIFTEIRELKKTQKLIPTCVIPHHILNGSNPVSPRVINLLHPDKIDTSYFWKKIKDEFGTLTITNEDSLTIEKANDKTLELAKLMGVIDEINLYENIKILEIGSGYGNLYNYLIDNGFDMNNYYSIDVVAYFFHDNLYITDGNSFPQNLPKFDLIYCFNSFQHMSQKQRDMYYENIFMHLNPGGVFLGGNILRHPQNEKLPIWQIKDKKGNDYVTFFGQYTKVETSEDFISKIKELGYSNFTFLKGLGNYLSFKIIK